MFNIAIGADAADIQRTARSALLQMLNTIVKRIAQLTIVRGPLACAIGRRQHLSSWHFATLPVARAPAAVYQHKPCIRPHAVMAAVHAHASPQMMRPVWVQNSKALSLLHLLVLQPSREASISTERMHSVGHEVRAAVAAPDQTEEALPQQQQDAHLPPVPEQAAGPCETPEQDVPAGGDTVQCIHVSPVQHAQRAMQQMLCQQT